MISYELNTDHRIVIENMVRVELLDGSEEGFRKVKETLQRIGIPNKNEKILNQSCHILHKAGRYYICHFLEMLALDGKKVEMVESDVARRNLIVSYLIQWGMVKPLSGNYKEPMGLPKTVKVIKYSEKDEWVLSPKYNIGVKKGVYNETKR